MILSQQEIKIIQNFFSDKPVLKAYLFGSFARNEGDSSSDIDVLVELDYSKHIGISFFKMKSDLEQMLKKKVDIISSLAVSKYILPFINKDKQLIYERDNS